MTDQSAGNESPTGAFGMAVVKEPARAIGITAIPTPIDESSDDSWFLHQFVHARYHVDVDGNTELFFDVEIDNKAMRRLEDGDAVVAVWENGPVGVLVNMQARLLIMLH